MSILSPQVPQGLTVKGLTPPKRVMRSPQHTFELRHRPYQIQPFLIAPVLAGETLKNAMFQARVVSDPVKNPLIGWWLEHYLFYIPLRAIQGSVGTPSAPTDMEKMLLDLSQPHADDTTDVVSSYFKGTVSGGVDWVTKCRDLVVANYFRDEGESVAAYALDGVPQAQIRGKTWLDSMTPDADMPSGSVDVTAGTPDTVGMEAFDGAYQTWLVLRNQQMTELTFEEYLQSFGVRPQAAKTTSLDPETIRVSSQWSYPANTVDPATGAPSSALSWSIQERADKERFFREPGFIFGVTVCRPKVYLSKQISAASSMLNNALTWLPAVLKNRVETSLKKIAGGDGPLGSLFAAADYWIDVRDLFVHGDQFVNFSLAETDAGLVALPATTKSASRYVVDADVDALFVTPATKNLIRQDGVVSLHVLGTQQDYT